MPGPSVSHENNVVADQRIIDYISLTYNPCLCAGHPQTGHLWGPVGPLAHCQ